MSQATSILVAFCLSVFSTLALILLRVNTQPLFFIFYLAAVVLLSLLVLVFKRYQLLSIIVFDLFVFAIFSLQFPLAYQVDRDSGFEAQYASTIVGLGYWDQTAGVGYAQDYYGYNPALHFSLAFSSLLSGISVDVLSKWIYIILLRIMFLLLAFVVLKAVSQNTELSYAAIFVYLITPRLRVIYISRRIVAAIAILACVFCIAEYLASRKAKFFLMACLLSLLILFCDHTLSILWLFFLFGAFVFYTMRSASGKTRSWTIWFLLCLVFGSLFLAYNLYLSPVILQGDLSYLVRIFSFFHTPGLGSSASVAPIYSSYQMILMIGSQLLLTFFAFTSFVRNFFKNSINPLLMYWSFAAFPAIVLLTYLLNTRWVVFANIIIWFFLLPICFFFSVFLKRALKSSLFFSIGIILFIFAGNLLLAYHPNVLFSDSNAAFVELPEYKNHDILDSAAWLANYTEGKPTFIIGDRSVFDIYSAYYGFVVSPEEIAKAFYASNLTRMEHNFLARPVYFGSYSQTAQTVQPDFVVVNLDLAANRSYEITLKTDDFKKFEETRFLKRIYQNANIVIYENTLKSAKV